MKPDPGTQETDRSTADAWGDAREIKAQTGERTGERKKKTGKKPGESVEILRTSKQESWVELHCVFSPLPLPLRAFPDHTPPP